MISRLSVFFLILFNVAVLGEDLPCVQRATEYGFVCVCNSSYCDTVERPTPLPKNQYYQYATGELSPGFTRSSGSFQNSNSDVSDIVFTIDPSVKYQEIMGFGGSFTDSVGVALAELPQGAQDKFLETYFGVNGVEYSAGRVVMAGSDFSPRIYTYDDTPNDKPDDDDLSHFSLQQEDLLYKIPLIQKALNLSRHNIRFVATPFSAPAWMKTNKQFSSGYIRNQYLTAWAKYYIKFLDSFAHHGIKFWQLTEGNEVAIAYNLGLPLPIANLGWPVNDRYFIKKFLGPQLRASNHSDVKYLPLDDQRNFVTYYMNKFMADPEAAEVVGGIAVHWYWDWIYPVSILDNIHRAYPDKHIVYTESSINTILFGGTFLQLGDWYRGSVYIYNIIDNFNHYTSAYLDWNLGLDLEGGPAIDIPCDAPIIMNATSGEFYKNPMFYAMGTFAKFMPPGAVRVKVTSNLNFTVNSDSKPDPETLRRLLLQRRTERANEPTAAPLPTFPPFPTPTVPKTVHCLATVNPDNSTTVVLYNGMDDAVALSVVDMSVTAGRISTTIPARTMHTFVYWPNSQL